jgi:hypothetical protein
MNRKILDKGIRNLLIALPLLFIGPSIIYNAWINKQNIWHYLVLAIGILLSFSAVYFLFKGVQKLTDSIFEK